MGWGASHVRGGGGPLPLLFALPEGSEGRLFQEATGSLRPERSALGLSANGQPARAWWWPRLILINGPRPSRSWEAGIHPRPPLISSAFKAVLLGEDLLGKGWGFNRATLTASILKREGQKKKPFYVKKRRERTCTRKTLNEKEIKEGSIKSCT